MNQIPNQIPHINIHRSIPSTPSVREKPVMRTIIFTVLLITPIISSFPDSSPILDRSKNQNNFSLIIFERMIVKTIRKIAEIILNKKSVENSHNKPVISVAPSASFVT